jgi:hypothetical protein
LLYRYGAINVDELTRRFVVSGGEEVKVSLWEEGVKDGTKVFVIEETKSRIYKNDFKEFDGDTDKSIRALQTDTPVYKFVFGFHIPSFAEEEAKDNDIKPIA